MTKDEDFAVRRSLAANGPSVLWIRLGNTRRRELIDWFEARLAAAIEALDSGGALVEIR